jgi:hypothetical protein
MGCDEEVEKTVSRIAPVEECLYVGRVVNPEQARAVINTAILTAVIDKGPTSMAW